MPITRLVRFLLLFGFSLLLIWGCSRGVSPVSQSKQISANCRQIEHDAGITTLCDRPSKIAVLSPYGLDLLLSLGEQPAAYAGVSASRHKFDRPAEQIPYLGDRIQTQPINLGDRHAPSLEALALLKPDLILGELWQGSQGNDKLLAQIAPTILIDNQQGNWQQNLLRVAKAIDCSDRIQPLLAERQARLAQARQELAKIVQLYPRVLLLASGDLTQGFLAFGQERSIYTNLLEALGFEIVRLDDSWLNFIDSTLLSLEILPQIQADFLIVIGWNKKDADNRPIARQQLQQDWNQIPVLRALPTSQAGRVYFMDAYMTMLRGPIAEAQILDDLLQQLKVR